MHPYLEAFLLGIIEGITEFLPISSTGHLLIAQHWLQPRSELFNIAIQAGAILAISLVYRQRIWALIGTLWNQQRRDALADIRREEAKLERQGIALDSEPQDALKPLFADVQHRLQQYREERLEFAHSEYRRQRDFIYKLILAFATTAVLGLAVKALGWQLPETVTPVAWALIIGGIFILIAENRLKRRNAAPAEADLTIGWQVAVLVGVAQVIAGVFPGTSRSAAAIFVALLFGVRSRATATEFAFLVGIPTMFAATAYALLSTLRTHGPGGEDWGQLLLAFATAAATGFIAVKWLLRYIQGHSFVPFAYYRFALGAALLWFLPSGS
jgi:undecaprenyl-diphosphatase